MEWLSVVFNATQQPKPSITPPLLKTETTLNVWLSILSQTTPPAGVTPPPTIFQLLQGPFIPILLGLLVLWVFVLRGKRKQEKSRKNMLEDVWNLREDTDTRAIDHFIARLRKYIEKEPARPRHLRTVRGVGYKFVAAPK